MIDPKKQMQKVISAVTTLQTRGFFGQLTLDFQGGNIVLMRFYETIKLEGTGSTVFVKEP